MLRRNHLVRVLNRIKSHEPNHAEAIDTMLASEPLMAQLQTKLKADLPPNLSNRPILEWLWDHRQMILQVILTIISMISGGS